MDYPTPLATSTWFNIPNLPSWYLSPTIKASLYHHFNFVLSLQPCKESNPIPALKASLPVIYEQPRIHLPPANTTDSIACVLSASKTSLVGLIAASKKMCALKLISLSLLILYNWFLPLSSTFFIIMHIPCTTLNKINPQVCTL